MKAIFLFILLLCLSVDTLVSQDYTNPTISPDGNSLVFGITYENGQHLYLSNNDGTNQNIIVAREGYNVAPQWSPDGSKIFYKNIPANNNMEAECFLLDLSNRSDTAVKVDGYYAVGNNDSSFDGNNLYYVVKGAKASGMIFKQNLKSGEIEQILPVKASPEYSGPMNSDQICNQIEILASDEFEGRKPGTPGGEKTVSYLKETFQKIGLKPGNGDSYFQQVPLANFSVIAPSKIGVKTRSKATLEIKHKEDLLFASKYAKQEITVPEAEWVYAGFGISAPELNWNDYKDVDVRGKVVLVLSGTPDQFTTDSTLWKGDLAANLYSQSFYKIQEAAKRGAIALISIYKPPSHSFWNWETLGESYGQNVTDIRKGLEETQLLFYGSISAEKMKELYSANGYFKTDYQKQALADNFQAVSLGVSPPFRFANTWTEINTNNVVGLIPGTESPDEAIIYTAHWDHVGMAPKNGDADVIFNGAVDNASGTAGIIEIANAYLNLPFKTKRTIMFIAMAAEEMGMLGSNYYIQNPIIPISKTLASFNMDAHFPYGKTTHITGVVYGRSELDKYLEMAALRQGRIIVPNTEQNIAQNIFFRSDHYPFAVAGIPSEFAVGAGNAMAHDTLAWQNKMANYMSKYHQLTDEYEKSFDCGGIAQDAELVFMAGVMLDQNKNFPMWYSSMQAFNRIRKASMRDSKKLSKNKTEKNKIHQVEKG